MGFMNLIDLVNYASYVYFLENSENKGQFSDREIVLRARSIFSTHGEDPMHLIQEMNQIEKITNEQKLLFITAFIEASFYLEKTCFERDLIELRSNDLSKINIQDQNKRTPLIIVCESSLLSGDLDFVQFLIDQKTDLEIEDVFGCTALMYAILKDRLDLVNLLLNGKAEINKKGERGFTPLEWAVSIGNLPIVKLLVQRGANLEVKNEKGFTPVYTAYAKKHFEIMKFLINQGADIKKPAEKGFTLLHIASQDGNLDVVKFLIEKGISVNTKTVESRNALQIATVEGYLDIARILIENGANLALKTPLGLTCLHYASKKQHLEMMKLFIRHGANVDALTKKKYSPLHFAVKYQRLDAVRLLVANKANLRIKTAEGETALCIAIRLGNLEIAKMLIEETDIIQDQQKKYEVLKTTYHSSRTAYHPNHLGILRLIFEKGLDVNLKDAAGNTLLHVASNDGKIEIVQFLLEMGADINARAEEGITPLHSACLNGHEKVVELLIANGADINAATYKGFTPLHDACVNNRLAIVKLLIQNEVKMQVRASRGVTPLHVASQHGNLETIKFLVEKGVFLDEINAFNKTALSIAVECNKYDAVNLLLDLGAGLNQRINDGFYALVHAVNSNYLGIFLSILEKNCIARAYFYKSLKDREFCRYWKVDPSFVGKARTLLDNPDYNYLFNPYLKEIELFSSIEIDTSSYSMCAIDDLPPLIEMVPVFEEQEALTAIEMIQGKIQPFLEGPDDLKFVCGKQSYFLKNIRESWFSLLRIAKTVPSGATSNFLCTLQNQWDSLKDASIYKEIILSVAVCVLEKTEKENFSLITSLNYLTQKLREDSFCSFYEKNKIKDDHGHDIDLSTFQEKLLDLFKYIRLRRNIVGTSANESIEELNMFYHRFGRYIQWIASELQKKKDDVLLIELGILSRHCATLWIEEMEAVYSLYKEEENYEKKEEELKIPFKLRVLASKHRAAILHFISSNVHYIKFFKKLIGEEFGIWGTRTSQATGDSCPIDVTEERLRSKFLSYYFIESFVFCMREELVTLYQKNPPLFIGFLKQIDEDLENSFEKNKGGNISRLNLQHAIQFMTKAGILKNKTTSSSSNE